MENKIEQVLDEAFEKAVLDRNNHPNVLIHGLTGSGKTAIVKDWLKRHDVHYCLLDASVYLRFEKYIDEHHGEDISKVHFVIFDELKENNSIMILDDFHYCPQKVLDCIIYPIVDNLSLPNPNDPNRPHQLKSFLFFVAIKTD